jgi:PP-loop superfamily ATP-utilizing enzyme
MPQRIIPEKLKKLDFKNVTLNVDGFQKGSMNRNSL